MDVTADKTKSPVYEKKIVNTRQLSENPNHREYETPNHLMSLGFPKTYPKPSMTYRECNDA